MGFFKSLGRGLLGVAAGGLLGGLAGGALSKVLGGTVGKQLGNVIGGTLANIGGAIGGTSAGLGEITQSAAIAQEMMPYLRQLAQLGYNVLEPTLVQLPAETQRYLAALQEQGYEPTAREQQLINQQLSMISNMRQQALANARAELARRGIRSGPIVQATLSALEQQLGETQQRHFNELLTNIRQQRLHNMQQGLAALGNLASIGQNLTMPAVSAMANPAQVLAAAAGQRFNMAQQNIGNTMGFLGSLASGEWSATGVPWSIGGWDGKRQQSAADTAMDILKRWNIPGPFNPYGGKPGAYSGNPMRDIGKRPL